MSLAAPLAVFRADASPAIGGGHVMRCLTLANTLAAHGWRCAFACRAETAETVPALARAGFDRLTLAGDGADVPRAMAARWPDGADWLVVDHYGCDIAFESACRPWARRVLAIDDGPGRRHDCDVLLDQNTATAETGYGNRIPSHAVRLFGPAYALLHDGFAARRRAALERRARGGPVRRILLAMGMTDPGDLLSPTLDALAAAETGAEIDIAIGGKAPHLDKVRDRATRMPGARLHVDAGDMAGLIDGAGLAVGGGGVSGWERCCLGLPSLVVAVADNQRPVIDRLVAGGAALEIRPRERDGIVRSADAIRSLAEDADWRCAMARAAALQCDGLGARRVAGALAPAVAGDGRPVRLRPAREDDGEIMLAWQAAPETRRYANDPRPPTRAGHFAWLARKLADPLCLFNVILHDETPAGLLRLDPAEQPDPAVPQYRISILVAPDRHRLGLGRAALGLARRLLPEAVFEAEVLPGNDASHALFRGAGFVPRGSDGLYIATPEHAA